MGAAVLDGGQPRACRSTACDKMRPNRGGSREAVEACRSVINRLRVGRRAADGWKEGFEKDNLDKQAILLR